MAVPLALLSAVLAGVAAFSALRRVTPWGSPEFWIAPIAAFWPFLVFVVASAVPQLNEVVSDENRGFAIAVGPLMVVMLWLGLARIRSRPRHIGLMTGVVTLIVAAAAIAAVVVGQSWMHGLIATVVLAGCALVGSSSRSAIAGGALLALVAMIGLIAVYATVLPQFALRTDCGQNTAKCGLLGGFISIGEESGSNAFAITLAMLGGFVVFRLRPWAATIMTVAVGSAALASGARLATACAIAVCAVALVAKLPRVGGLATAAATTVALISSLSPTAVPFSEHFLTDRGSLWARARDMMLDAPLFGHGLSFWVRDAQTQVNPPRSYSPHNVWLDLLIGVGILGTVAIAIAVGLGIMLSVHEAHRPALMLVIGVLITGCFEATFTPFRINPVPAGMIVLLAYLSASQRLPLFGRTDEPSLTAPPVSRPA